MQRKGESFLVDSVAEITKNLNVMLMTLHRTFNMIIEIPRIIRRDFIRNHETLYYFLYSAPVSLAKSYGQIAEILDTCCYPVPTRWKLCRSSGFFNDNEFDDVSELIDSWLNDVPKDRPVIPFLNIGCGGSRMRDLAPKLYAHLVKEIDKIKYPHIVYVGEEIGKERIISTEL